MDLSIVDYLLVCLAEQPRNVAMVMRTTGYTQDQISEAWTEARAAMLTESSGLGQDRLTDAGRIRAAELVQEFVR